MAGKKKWGPPATRIADVRAVTKILTEGDPNPDTEAATELAQKICEVVSASHYDRPLWGAWVSFPMFDLAIGPYSTEGAAAREVVQHMSLDINQARGRVFRILPPPWGTHESEKGHCPSCGTSLISPYEGNPELARLACGGVAERVFMADGETVEHRLVTRCQR